MRPLTFTLLYDIYSCRDGRWTHSSDKKFIKYQRTKIILLPIVGFKPTTSRFKTDCSIAELNRFQICENTIWVATSFCKNIFKKLFSLSFLYFSRLKRAVFLFAIHKKETTLFYTVKLLVWKNKKMVGSAELESATNNLKGCCSTIELRTQRTLTFQDHSRLLIFGQGIFSKK